MKNRSNHVRLLIIFFISMTIIQAFIFPSSLAEELIDFSLPTEEENTQGSMETGEITLETSVTESVEEMPSVVSSSFDITNQKLPILEPEPQLKERKKPIKRAWTDEEIIALGYVPDQVIVKFKRDKVDLRNSAGRNKAESFADKFGDELPKQVIREMRKKSKKAERLSQLSNEKLRTLDEGFLKQKNLAEKRNEALYEVAIDDGVMELIEELKNDPDVEMVMPNLVFEFTSLDPTEQWNMETIEVEGAWTAMGSEGSQEVVVAIMDSGIAYDHSDLVDNMWTPSSCKDSEGNTIGGGCPNHGWDFFDNDDDPNDFMGHGTHVAGIVGAVRNEAGVIGVSPNVTLMALKVGDAYGTYFAINDAINFARENGADIINGSFSFSLAPYVSPYQVSLLIDGLNEFLENGGLYVASAGNETNDNDLNHAYPSDYLPKSSPTSDDIFFDNIISVAATDENDALASFSNYGKTSVDLAAPGTGIESTSIDLTGTIPESFDGFGGIPLWGMFEKFGTENNNWETGFISLAQANGLFTDLQGDTYGNNANTTVRTDVGAFDLPELRLANQDASFGLEFKAWCDTEPRKMNAQGNLEAKDYMEVVLIENPGEPSETPHPLGSFQPDGTHVEGSNHVYEEMLGEVAPEWNGYQGNKDTVGLNIPDNLLTLEDTVFQFTWITDASNDDSTDHRGCYIDDVKVTFVEVGEEGEANLYTPLQGTSMSAPHVAGVAALLMAYSEEEELGLTAGEIKHIIMQSGEDVAELVGKTVSGKRLNASNAITIASTYVAPDVRLFADAPTIVNGSGYADSNETLENAYITFPDLEDDHKVKFRLVNSSRESLSSISAQITGTDAGEFSILDAPATSLDSQHSTEIIVSFEPTEAGWQEAVMEISYTDSSGSDTFTVNLGADNDTAPTTNQNIVVKDTAGATIANGGEVDFGSLIIGTSANRSIAIHNTGGKPLSIQSASIQQDGGGVSPFSFVGSPPNGTIGVGQSMFVPIFLSGGTAGSYTSRLFIVSNDEDEEVYEVILEATVATPTIHSKTSGGYWNSASTWVENRVPNSSDIAEVNGTVTLNANKTVGALVVKQGKTLINLGNSDHTLTVNGDVLNHGTIKNANTSRDFTMKVSGDIEHNGTWTPRKTHLTGTSERSITGSASLGGTTTVIDNIVMVGNSQMGGTTNLTGSVTVNAPYSLTIKGHSSTSGGGINGTGTVIYGGGNQNFGGGTVDVSEIVFGGTGTKTLNSSITLKGDITVNDNVTVINLGNSAYTLTLDGDVVNEGSIIKASTSAAFTVKVSGDLDNNDTWTAPTQVIWPDQGSTATYDIQLTDTSGNWQAEIDRGTDEFYALPSGYTGQVRDWRWRTTTGGVDGEWSEVRNIN